MPYKQLINSSFQVVTYLPNGERWHTINVVYTPNFKWKSDYLGPCSVWAGKGFDYDNILLPTNVPVIWASEYMRNFKPNFPGIIRACKDVRFPAFITPIRTVDQLF